MTRPLFILRCLLFLVCAWTWRTLSNATVAASCALMDLSLRCRRALRQWQARLTLESSDVR